MQSQVLHVAELQDSFNVVCQVLTFENSCDEREGCLGIVTNMLALILKWAPQVIKTSHVVGLIVKLTLLSCKFFDMYVSEDHDASCGEYELLCSLCGILIRALRASEQATYVSVINAHFDKLNDAREAQQALTFSRDNRSDLLLPSSSPRGESGCGEDAAEAESMDCCKSMKRCQFDAPLDPMLIADSKHND